MARRVTYQTRSYDNVFTDWDDAAKFARDQRNQEEGEDKKKAWTIYRIDLRYSGKFAYVVTNRREAPPAIGSAAMREPWCDTWDMSDELASALSDMEKALKDVQDSSKN